MLQYLSIIFLWSIFHHIQTPQCMSMMDINFIALIIFASVDSVAHMIKAYKTLKAEYHLITGVPLSDCFLYLWPLMQFFKKLNIWLGVSLLINVSPTACVDSPLLGCMLLAISIVIYKSSKRLRKWWIHNHYDTVPTSVNGPTGDNSMI